MTSHKKYQSCIDPCVSCAQEFETCAVPRLQEDDVQKMTECILTDRDCAAMCWTTTWLMSRGSEFKQEVCRLCAEICEACADACDKHVADHCQQCATACRQCAEECRQMARATAWSFRRQWLQEPAFTCENAK